MNWNLDVVVAAFERLNREGIRAQVVGTLALAMHGADIHVPDIDILCERLPTLTEAEVSLKIAQFKGDIDADVPSAGLRTIVLGTHVDYINTREGDRMRFMCDKPDVLFGIPVATCDMAIAMKKWCSREKDVGFLRGWQAACSIYRVNNP